MISIKITYQQSGDSPVRDFIHTTETTDEDYAYACARQALLDLLDREAGTVGTADFETIAESVVALT